MADLAQLSFELERFEWAADDRLEVAGRWYGVRGRRFVRPTLHVRAGGRRRRMIALLDHKPWAADEEAVWIAAFAWRGPRETIGAAPLEGAPHLALQLPPPRPASPRATGPSPPPPGAPPAGPPAPPPPRPRRIPAADATPPATAAETAPAEPGAAETSSPPPATTDPGAAETSSPPPATTDPG